MEDNRCYPDGAAAPPIDKKWKDGNPRKKGWYFVALWNEEPPYGYIYSLPTDTAYWTGKRWKGSDYLNEKYYWEDEDGGCMCQKYYVEYWQEINDEEEAPSCEMNY